MSCSKNSNGIIVSREDIDCQIRDKKDQSLNITDEVSFIQRESIDIELSIDTSSIEIFVNEESTITTTFYALRSHLLHCM